MVLGGVREAIGQGTLFADASMLLGQHFAFLELRLEGYRGVLLMILPPGGFLALGFPRRGPPAHARPRRRATSAPAQAPRSRRHLNKRTRNTARTGGKE